MEEEKCSKKLQWYNAAELLVQGKGWEDTEYPYDRLPVRAKGSVRQPVWELGKCPAGVSIRFTTDSSSLCVRWDGIRSMSHMPATGVSGVDLYTIYEGAPRWLAVGIPESERNESLLFCGLPQELRDYILYLPLYSPTTEVGLGIPPRFIIRPARPSEKRPLVFYGTSITQGGCASRPGMCYPSILSRKLDIPAINLGFSGNGIMEPEVIDLLCELEPSVYVLDNMPNMKAELVRHRAGNTIKKLAAARPNTPIVIVESMFYCDAFLKKERFDRCGSSNKTLRAVSEKLMGDGIENLHYVEGGDLIGGDGEATVDGTHFSDLGFIRFSEKIFPLLKKLTSGPTKK